VKFELRLATPRDALQIADLQIAAWRAAFLPILPDGFEIPPREQFLIMGERTPAEPGVERTVATADRVMGFLSHGPSRDEGAPERVGEVRALFVHPEAWGHGLGAALVANALERLRGNGFQEVTLWSFRDNHRANAFYERQGFEPDGASQAREAFAGTVEIRLRQAL
jgi:GNAT superfamily N-acetyltransferase